MRYRVWLKTDGWYQIDEEYFLPRLIRRPKARWDEVTSCRTLEEAEDYIKRHITNYEAAKAFKTRYYPA